MSGKYLQQAIDVALAAGNLLAGRSEELLAVDSALGKDFKLAADREAETLIREQLAETGLPILGEEMGYSGQDFDS